MKKEKYDVTGMTCAACSARIEKAVSKTDGVTSCSVNLLTNSMVVEGDVSPSVIINAVKKAGYGASVSGHKPEPQAENDTFKALKTRLISSVVFLAVLMYFSMGYTMWGFPLPSFLSGNYIAIGIIQLLLTIIIMFINRQFFISGFKAVINKSPNMDTLVSLGAGASFIYSLYALFAMSDAQIHSGSAMAAHYMHEFYFESAAMILSLITLGKLLEERSKGKTTDAIKGLMTLTPQTATVIINGKETQIDVSELKIGDTFIVKPGGSIPCDGIITEGHTAIDESALTGESIPADKSIGDAISGGTINLSGYIKATASSVGEETLISRIIKMVSDASATKAPVAKAADKISGIFVPSVMAIAILTFIIWLIIGKSVGEALSFAISVLVISCPCALGLATPVSIMVGNGVGAKNGILFKTASALENTGKITNVVLDKTGTVTNGKPKVCDILPLSVTETELLSVAYSLESKSSHPLAQAISEKAIELGIELKASDNFTEFPGNGLSATTDGDEIRGGKLDFIKEKAMVTNDVQAVANELANSGKTPLFFARNSHLIGIIAVADTIKPDSPKAIRELKDMGINVVMLTGDNVNTANAIKTQAGIDEVIAGVLPDGKAEVINKLTESGKTAMVGDGINDAPALTAADIGIAIGSGRDIAIDAADIVLMNNSLSGVAAAVRLSRATLKNIHQNLFWAFIYNTIGIPLAAGVFTPLGLKLNPMFGAAAMSLSSFFVVSNALRLNLTNVRSTKKDKKIKHKKETKTMKKTLKIEGMMCPHCESTVKKCLEATDGVIEADVSHKDGTAIVKLSKDTDSDTLKKAVTEQGYTVTDIVSE